MGMETQGRGRRSLTHIHTYIYIRAKVSWTGPAKAKVSWTGPADIYIYIYIYIYIKSDRCLNVNQKRFPIHEYQGKYFISLFTGYLQIFFYQFKAIYDPF